MNNIPLLLHCPRGAGRITGFFYKKVRPHFLKHWKKVSGNGIEVITYNNHEHLFPVEVQMANMGVRHHTLAKNCRPWSFSGKIIPVLEYLDSGAISSPLIMLIDGNDTVFTRFPTMEEVTAHLENYAPADIVFCSTPANWPPDGTCKKYESWRYPKPDCHISTGAYVGRVDQVIKGLRWIRDRMPAKPFNRADGGFDDQLAWRKAHFAGQFPMGIDSKCLLFKRCGLWLEEAFKKIILDAENNI